MKRRRGVFVVLLLTLFCFASINSCRKASSPRNTSIIFSNPEGFPQPTYDFQSNPLTEEGFALGKKLFYDNRMSKNYDVSCGSCHQQLAAFTTFDHDLGHGTNNQHTTRNVPSIFNMAWHTEFGWDGKISGLEEQILSCITAPERMDESADEIIARLDTSIDYQDQFAKAFGDRSISGDKIAKALSQFVVMIVSADSKYDRVKKGSAEFSPNQAAGYELFKMHCTGCHAEPLFTDFSYRNIGLPHRNFHEDAGRMLVTGAASDSLKFKVPSLRNVAITSYYAHDGRFAGVTQSIDHYASGVEQSATVDPLLRDRIQLSELEKYYMLEFLFTLTDSALINDTRFR